MEGTRDFMDTLKNIPYEVNERVDSKYLVPLAVLGFTYAVYHGFARPFSAFLKHFVRPRKDFRKIYGDGWVLVTGASDGIGKEYCMQLAKAGYSIVLVARNKEKLEFVAQSLQQQYDVGTRVVVFDFSRDFSESMYINELYNKVQDLDIAIVVNNVGIYKKGPFDKMQLDDLRQLINVNVNSTTFVTKYLYKKLLERSSKSAVINVSSFLWNASFPYAAMYGATKAYMNIFNDCLSLENPDKIDFMAHEPYATRTNMNMKDRPGVIEPDQAVRTALDKLGYGESCTTGHWKHDLYGAFKHFGPVRWYLLRATYRTYSKPQ